MKLQNFNITAIDNDRPNALMPDTVQYTIRWGDLSHRRVLTYLELERGDNAIEDYLLRTMFLDMCVKAWDESDHDIDRIKFSALDKQSDQPERSSDE